MIIKSSVVPQMWHSCLEFKSYKIHKKCNKEHKKSYTVNDGTLGMAISFSIRKMTGLGVQYYFRYYPQEDFEVPCQY